MNLIRTEDAGLEYTSVEIDSAHNVRKKTQGPMLHVVTFQNLLCFLLSAVSGYNLNRIHALKPNTEET
jgi:delta 1-pyrroline-5-carboxylate dehydrogenase